MNVRPDRDVVEHFESGGQGWQVRLNEAIRKVGGLQKEGAAARLSTSLDP